MRALSMKKGNCEWNGFESFQDDYEKKFGEPPKVSSPDRLYQAQQKDLLYQNGPSIFRSGVRSFLTLWTMNSSSIF